MSGKVAFLGLGAMGFGMATNLVKKGFQVTGFDIYPPTLERFAAAGGIPSSSPRETARDAQYVVFMVATAAQVLTAMFEGEKAAVHELAPNSVLVLCSTGPPGYVANVKKILGENERGDVEVVDAPVSGGTIRAAAGTLSIFASGKETSLKAARTVLDAMAGEHLWIIEGGLGAGTNVKMVHQVLAGIHILMASEAMGFSAALGLNTKYAYERLKTMQGNSWMFENRVPHMLGGDETVYSALNIIVKDVGIVTAGGRAAKFPLFLASTTEQVLASGVSAGLGLLDDSNLKQVYLPRSPALVFNLAGSSDPSSKDEKKLKLVDQIMAAVHLAAAIEAMSLGKQVGLDPKKLFDIISTAAGTSFQFVNEVPRLLSGTWSKEKTVNDIIADLTQSLEEANRMKYPLHLAGTALQLFQLAAMKGYGDESVLTLAKLFDCW